MEGMEGRREGGGEGGRDREGKREGGSNGYGERGKGKKDKAMEKGMEERKGRNERRETCTIHTALNSLQTQY